MSENLKLMNKYQIYQTPQNYTVWDSKYPPHPQPKNHTISFNKLILACEL